MEYLKHLRTLSLIFLAGTATGGYGVYAQVFVPFDNIATAGNCRGHDRFDNRYWFNCIDSAVALELQQRAVAHDEETAAILADMNKPAKKVRK